MTVDVKAISICHVASGDRWAGAEVQIRNLLRALARKGRFLLSVILLNDGRLAEECRRCGLEVLVLPESRMTFFRIMSEGAAFLGKKNIQIIHSHRYKENLLAFLLARRCGIPRAVRTQHGLPEPFRGLKRYKWALFRQLDRFVARCGTDRVISVSEEMRSRLTKSLKPETVVTIHNGIDPQEVYSSLDPKEAKKALGVPEGSCVVGTAGRLEPIKRLDILLSAAQIISERLPNCRFVIAGDGSQERRLREFAHEKRLGDRILFLGHREDLYDVLRAMDVFVLSSDHEGLPMALLEALCLGVAVVARRVGGIPEVVQDGRNGVLLDTDNPQGLAEACISILSDEDRRRRLASAGPASVAERFSVSRTADQVTDLYYSLCGAP